VYSVPLTSAKIRFNRRKGRGDAHPTKIIKAGNRKPVWRAYAEGV